MGFSLFPSDPSGAKSPTFAKILAWGAGLGIAVGVAPIIFLAVKGIVGLALAFVIGTLCLRLAPVFSMWTSNLVLKAIRWEARRNPIETMMNVYMERKEAVAAAEVAIKAFNGQVQNYGQQIDGLAKKYPEDAKKFQDHYQAMQALLNQRYRALKTAEAGLVKYNEGIERASAIWEMTKASDAISKSAGLLSEKDAIQRIKSDEALKSVEESMARSFAELDHALRTEIEGTQINSQPSLPAPTDPTMLIPDVNNVYSAQPVPVQQRKV